MTRIPTNIDTIDRTYPNYTSVDFPLTPPPCIPERFSLGSFLARYWCGDNALREDRSVSRKRLILAKAKVDNGDRQAQSLQRQIDQYEKAFQLVLNRDFLTVEFICQINSILTENHSKSGKIRIKQNFIGDPSKPRYVPPQASAVPALLQDLCEFTNDSAQHPLARAIMLYCQLLAIHPFHDGNGRTARVLRDALLQKWGLASVSLSYNRMLDEKNYLEAIEHFGIRGKSGLKHPYWSEALTSAAKLGNAANAIFEQAQIEMSNRFAAFRIDEDVRVLGSMLWQQPIIYQNNLAATQVWTQARFVAGLETLIRAGILEWRELKTPQGAMILDCPLVFRAWQKIDEIIFAHENKLPSHKTLMSRS